MEEFNSGSVSKIIELIKNPHPFLPETDKPKLTELQKQIQQRLDEDVITRIETQFRQINDREKRSQCLRQLQKIIDE